MTANSTTLAIDPGNHQSAYCLIDSDRKPVAYGKVLNGDLLDLLMDQDYHWKPTTVAVEMVVSYGMAVGADVFETCVWIGRFVQTLTDIGYEPQLITRRPIKLHFCNSAKANDSNIKQALVDRFASGVSNHGKGSKAAPGWFYGFSADVWSAYALAVYAADTEEGIAA